VASIFNTFREGETVWLCAYPERDATLHWRSSFLLDHIKLAMKMKESSQVRSGSIANWGLDRCTPDTELSQIEERRLRRGMIRTAGTLRRLAVDQ
jgi:hypothetical protein